MLIEKKQYELPTEDIHMLAAVDIGEVKKVQTQYGAKDKFTIKFEVLDQKDSKTDETLYVFGNFSPSLGDKAVLGKFVRRLGFDTAQPFDTDDLLGLKFSAMLTHNQSSNGNTHANIVPGTEKVIRQGKSAPAAVKTAKPLESDTCPKKAVMTDDDIPF